MQGQFSLLFSSCWEMEATGSNFNMGFLTWAWQNHHILFSKHVFWNLLESLETIDLSDKSNRKDVPAEWGLVWTTLAWCFLLSLATFSTCLCLKQYVFRLADARCLFWSFAEPSTYSFKSNNNWNDGLKHIRTYLFLLSMHKMSELPEYLLTHVSKTKPSTKSNHKWDLGYYRYIHIQIK